MYVLNVKLYVLLSSSIHECPEIYEWIFRFVWNIYKQS